MCKCKNNYFYHIFFVSLGGRPCGNHVKCYIDGKRIRIDGHRVTALMYTHRAVIEHDAPCPRQLRVGGCEMKINYELY